MNSFLNTKIIIDKSIVEKRIDFLDIPMISEENAIFCEISRDEYQTHFNIPIIRSGIIQNKGSYYFFDHNIVKTPHNNVYYRGTDGSNGSYDILEISESMFKKIKDNNGHYTSWEIIFDNFYHFGKRFIHINKGGYPEILEYISYFDESGNLIIPYDKSPSGIKDGTTIGEFLENHRKNYPKESKLELNKSALRNTQIDNILNEIYTRNEN